MPIPVAALNKMGARIDGKPFSVEHLKRLSPLQLAEQLRFDGKKLARYLHQADYGTVEAQQAVRFLRQQIPTEGSMESLLRASTDPKLRQDLIVEGSLSLAGALVSIGVPIAFAIGGTAAAVAGPVRLAFGAALLLAGGIYSAVREVEEIKKVIALDGWETFQAGVLAFTGQDQTYSVENQLMAYKVKTDAEKVLTARLNKAAKTLGLTSTLRRCTSAGVKLR